MSALERPVERPALHGRLSVEVIRLRLIPTLICALFCVAVSYAEQTTKPYITQADAAKEAKRKFEDPPIFTIQDANAPTVTVHVDAGPDFRTADSVDNVIIKRGETIHRPVAKTLSNVTITNSMNASKEIIVGLFTFPLELFAPSGDPFVLVVVGKTRNVEISMTPEQLGELR